MISQRLASLGIHHAEWLPLWIRVQRHCFIIKRRPPLAQRKYPSWIMCIALMIAEAELPKFKMNSISCSFQLDLGLPNFYSNLKHISESYWCLVHVLNSMQDFESLKLQCRDIPSKVHIWKTGSQGNGFHGFSFTECQRRTLPQTSQKLKDVRCRKWSCIW